MVRPVIPAVLATSANVTPMLAGSSAPEIGGQTATAASAIEQMTPRKIIGFREL